MPGVKPAWRRAQRARLCEKVGEVAERFKAPVLKTGVVAIPPRVRISPSPPNQ
jgi:hypothetical protein